MNSNIKISKKNSNNAGIYEYNNFFLNHLEEK